MAVLTMDRMKGVLVVYLIDGQSGKILYNSVVKEADLDKPISLIADSNSYMVSYYNMIGKNYEIWNIEMFLRRTDNSAIDLLY